MSRGLSYVLSYHTAKSIIYPPKIRGQGNTGFRDIQIHVDIKLIAYRDDSEFVEKDGDWKAWPMDACGPPPEIETLMCHYILICRPNIKQSKCTKFAQVLK